MKTTTFFCLAALASLGNAQGTWLQSGLLEPASGYASSDNYFGRSVAMHGDWALVGSPALDAGTGIAHVFERSVSHWVERAVLTPANELPFTDFGRSAALHDGTAVVGAPGEDDLAGRVHVFVGAGAEWDEVATLQAPGAEPRDAFGATLALEGDTLLVGAPGIESVHVFERTAGTWNHVQRLTVPGGADDFGAAIAMQGDVIVVGAPGDDAAYVFRRGASWALDAVLGSGLGSFGQSVTISGDRIAVGAPDDFGAGSVHVFDGSSGSWIQTEEITHAGLDPAIEFGHTVALSGDSLVVGSPGDNAVLGAAYIYRHVDGVWVEEAGIEAYLGEGVEGQFGTYVGVWGSVMLANIGIDDIVPFGFYAGAVLIWTLDSSPGDPPRSKHRAAERP